MVLFISGPPCRTPSEPGGPYSCSDPGPIPCPRSGSRCVLGSLIISSETPNLLQSRPVDTLSSGSLPQTVQRVEVGAERQHPQLGPRRQALFVTCYRAARTPSPSLTRQGPPNPSTLQLSEGLGESDWVWLLHTSILRGLAGQAPLLRCLLLIEMPRHPSPGVLIWWVDRRTPTGMGGLCQCMVRLGVSVRTLWLPTP